MFRPTQENCSCTLHTSWHTDVTLGFGPKPVLEKSMAVCALREHVNVERCPKRYRRMVAPQTPSQSQTCHWVKEADSRETPAMECKILVCEEVTVEYQMILL